MAIIDFRRLGVIGHVGAYECGACGSVVTSPETHQTYHDNINKIFESFSQWVQTPVFEMSRLYTFEEVRIIGGETILIPVKLENARKDSSD